MSRLIHTGIIQQGSLLNTLLPQKLIVQEDKYVEEMDEIGDFTAFQGSLSLNSSEVYSGTNSIKLTGTEGRHAVIRNGTINWDLSKDNGSSIQVMVYPHTALGSAITQFKITALTSTGNYYYINIAITNIKINKWQELRKISDVDINSHKEWTKVGNPSWSNITYISVQLYTADGATSICSFDFLRSGGLKKPAVLLQFDDVPSSVYTLAYPEFAKRRMKGTVYMVSDYINHNEMMTASQLQSLYNAGWTVGNHTKSHPDLSTLTQSEIETEITECNEALLALGINTGMHVAYPFGKWDQTVSDALLAVGALTGRGGYPDINDSVLHYNDYFPYQLNWGSHEIPVLKDILDRAIFQNLTVCFVFHGIVESGAVGIERNLSDLIELLDYIEELGFQTLTIDEWYRLYSSDIVVNHN